MRILRPLLVRWRGNRNVNPHPGPQGQEHEILVQEQERLRVNELFGARLIRKGRTPFLDEDLDDP